MDKVNIILCTYNGEKHLPTLLDSLFAQTYRCIDIYARDDGSKDGTIDILERYAARLDIGISLHIVRDDVGNVGYVKNFLRTIRASESADYYAFCDQDDYWLPEKIQRAVEMLASRPTEKCLLYSSAYEARDGQLNFLSEGHVPTPMSQLDVGKSLCLYDGGWLLGFTLVINRTLMLQAFDNDAQEMYSHDIWVQAVTAGFGGELLYDQQVTAYFRRHDHSVSIAESNVNRSFLAVWKYRWQESFSNGKMFSRLKSGMETYAALYGTQVLQEKDRCFLARFGISDGKAHTWRKLTYPHRMKQSLTVELAWRFAIILKKI